MTVADALEAWLETKRGVVRPNTLASYQAQVRSYILGPLLPGEARRAAVRSGKGEKPKAKPILLLGSVKVADLTTRGIREWHRLISDEVSPYPSTSLHLLSPTLGREEKESGAAAASRSSRRHSGVSNCHQLRVPHTHRALGDRRTDS